MEFTFSNETVTVRSMGDDQYANHVAEIRIVLKDGGSPQYFDALRELSYTLRTVVDVMIDLNPWRCERHKDVSAIAMAINEKGNRLAAERLASVCAESGQPTSEINSNEIQEIG